MAIQVEQVRRDDAARREKVTEARKLIYEAGYVVNSTKVDDLLKSESMVPTENTFSERLAGSDFDVFDALVVDFMHKTELGDFKNVIKHLVRILNTQGADVVLEFNERFRQVAPFGRSTIHRFPHNVSDMKKLGARNYEDILQCLIPCVDGLLPSPHNETILSLLYTCTYWHSLAKLRMHTDSALKVLDAVTTLLGRQMRYFASVMCPKFKTVETDSEYAAQSRAATRREAAKTNTGSNPAPSNLPNTQTQTSGKRAVVFSLNTYKHHSMGDYAPTIHRFGTTDSYSTQIGELQHQVVKRWNGRSNQNNAIPQIIKMDVRETANEQMEQEIARLAPHTTPQLVGGAEPIPLDQHHRIARDESTKIYVPEWYFTPEALAAVNIQHDRILAHATAAFNYTTYDVRRDQDTINANTDGCHIMVKSNEESEGGLEPHPYWYARVLGVFHANMFQPGSRAPHRYEFLWVRWLGRDPEWKSGPSHLRLKCVGYIPETDPEAFGFIDPAHVLRPSLARDFSVRDWINYYVMRFMDRDMMMRYLGIGAGHLQPGDFPSEVNALDLLEEQCPELGIVVPSEDLSVQDPGAQNSDTALQDTEPLHSEDIQLGDKGSSGDEEEENEDNNDCDF
ncbi:hypothetical protein DFH09DRAFT_1329080 [Mycena vulgaris]|nr:hypothetical protein DFH09DRAFT_1329080 [Mycena vulgaris]